MGASLKKIKTPTISLSEFPEDIVEHIFSHLHPNNKTAIQLSLLSKELFNIMQRRPALVFDHENCFKAEEDPNSEYVNRYREELEYMVSTFTRYEEQSIHLETFTFKANLHLDIEHHLVSRLIQSSIQKGITKLDLTLPPASQDYVVPQSVFEAESLVELSLGFCTLHPERGTVAWPNLKRLHLRIVYFQEDGVFEDITKGTNSFIECVTISLCHKSNSGSLNFKFPSAWNRNLKQLEMDLRDNQTLDWNALQNLQVRPDSECKNLRSLTLNNVRIEDNIFLNFPQLEELDIQACENQSIKVSSRSLKKLTLGNSVELQEASLDVPNIVKFQFINRHHTDTSFPIPELSFRGNSSGWVSTIEVRVSEDSDFIKLKRFLAALLNSSETRVTVNLVGTAVSLDEANLITLPGPIIPKIQEFCVSTLEKTYSVSFARAILNGIFGICRPKRLAFWHWSSDVDNWCHRNFFRVEYVWNTTLPQTSHYENLLKLLRADEKVQSFRTTFNLKYIEQDVL